MDVDDDDDDDDDDDNDMENSSVFCEYLWPDSSDISHLAMVGRILSHC